MFTKFANWRYERMAKRVKYYEGEVLSVMLDASEYYNELAQDVSDESAVCFSRSVYEGMMASNLDMLKASIDATVPFGGSVARFNESIRNINIILDGNLNDKGMTKPAWLSEL